MNKIYKIITMSRQEIVLDSRESLDKFLEQANQGKKLILTKYGIVNISSIDSIVPHKELMARIAEEMRLGVSEEAARAKVFGSSATTNWGTTLEEGKNLLA